MTIFSRRPRPGASPSRAASTFPDLTGDTEDGGAEKDEAKAALEKQLQDEKDARSEERFVWIVVTVILVDVLWFRNSANVTLPVVILVLELIMLLVLARRMGIQEIAQLIDRLIHSVGRGAGGGA